MKFLIFFGNIFLAINLFASEYRVFYRGIRAQAMGGAQVAVVNDETALIVNPSALGKLRNFYGTLFDPELDVSGSFLNLYQAQPFSNFFDPVSVAPTVLASPGTPYHADAKLFPSFVGKNFGFGVFAHYLLNTYGTNHTVLRELYYRNDLAFVLGYNLRLFDGRVKIGFNGKLVSRQEIDLTTVDTTTTTNLSVANLGKEGAGTSADASLILTGPWTYLPTLAVVVHDVGGTNFTQQGVRPLGNANGTPTSQTQDLDIGLSVSPIYNKFVRSTWTVEYSGYLSAQNETDPVKRYHFGYEMNFGDLFFLRAGYNQRYWTAGMELATEKFQFQVASYGEEVGTAAVNEEDRRFVAKFAFRF